MDQDWAISEVQTFVAKCEEHTGLWVRAGSSGPPREIAGPLHDDVRSRLPIIKKIADRAWPDWREHEMERAAVSWEYEPILGIARQLEVLLRRSAELEEKLGAPGPVLSVSTMHRDVWDAASSLWRNGHFGEAVSAAAKSVNAAMQSKVGRRDLSDSKLVAECFTPGPPGPGSPRLRLMADDGSDTYKSLHSGALNFGQGCFMAIRNVLAHEYGPLAEPPEEEALHYLAAFSILARWVEKSTVQR